MHKSIRAEGPRTWQCAHSRRCACPRARVPFRCSARPRYATSQSRAFVRASSACIPPLKRCARARVFADFRRFAARVPFRCSARPRYTAFRSSAPVRAGPACIPPLKRCTRARVFAVLRRFARVRFCASFRFRFRSRDRRVKGLGLDNALFSRARSFPGPPLDL